MVNVETGEERFEQSFPSYPGLVLFPRSPLVMVYFHERQAHRTERDETPQRLQIWNWRRSELLCDVPLPIQQGSPLRIPSIAPDESFMTFGWGNNYYVRYELTVDSDSASIGSRTQFEKTSRVRGPLIFTPDGKYAAASLKNGQCLGVIFDVQSKSVIHRLDPSTARASNQSHEYGCQLAFSSDGTRLVMADHNGRVALWAVPNGEFIAELGRFQSAGAHHPPKIAVTSDDHVIIAGDLSDSRITIQPLPLASGAVSSN
jgi:WD40 repeat protein